MGFKSRVGGENNDVSSCTEPENWMRAESASAAKTIPSTHTKHYVQQDWTAECKELKSISNDFNIFFWQ